MTTIKTSRPDLIEALNRRAIELLETDDEVGTAYEACRKAAREAGFDFEREDGDPDKAGTNNGSSCELWRHSEIGVVVNLWTDATSGEIEDGGLGFDDNVAWAFESI